MPAVLRKILGSSTYFLMCCGSELSHMTTPTYEKGWENVTCILGSHVPGQTPGDNAVEEVSPAVSRLVSRGSPLPRCAPATGVPFAPHPGPARTYLKAFAPAGSSVWHALPQTTRLVPYHPGLSSNVASSEGPSLTGPVPPALLHAALPSL